MATVETKDHQVYRRLDNARILCLLVGIYAVFALINATKDAISGDPHTANLVISIILIGMSFVSYIVIGYIQGIRLLTRKWTVKVKDFTLLIDCIRPCGENEAVFLTTYRCPMEEIECVDQIKPGFTTIWRRTEHGDIRILTTCPADIIMLALKDATPTGSTHQIWTYPPDKKEDSE